MRRIREAVGVMGLLMATALGCGPAGPAVQSVEGIVTLDGQPVEGAAVFFSPAPGSTGLPAAGQTDSDGRFRLTSVKAKTGGGGAVAGDYLVTVSKIQNDAAPLPTSTDDPNYGKFPPAPGPNEKAKIKYLVPQEYGDAKTSGLKATVAKGGSKDLKFELSAKPAGK